MKRMLMLASVASMIDQFNMPNIELLQEMGYEVHVACNFEKGSTCTDEKVLELKKKLKQLHVSFFQIDFERNVMKLNQDLKAYKQVLKLARKYHYTFIHCHSPIGGVVGRMVGHKTNTKVIYTAHGFHFYKGAPLLNWLIYYPIEKFFSRFTDVLITINKEDYKRAKKMLHAKSVEYIPGVGIDVSKFKNIVVDKKEKREELKIKDDDVILLSVGELNKNKNHEAIIRTLACLQQQNIQYLIVGKGELRDYLEKLARELEIENQVHILGFRNDVVELYKMADVFVFPSKREGLSVALMEAMASGIPCAVSCIRGNIDMIEEGKGGTLFSVFNNEEIKRKIKHISNASMEERIEQGNFNQIKAEKFDVNKIKERMFEVYMGIINI